MKLLLTCFVLLCDFPSLALSEAAGIAGSASAPNISTGTKTGESVLRIFSFPEFHPQLTMCGKPLRMARGVLPTRATAPCTLNGIKQSEEQQSNSIFWAEEGGGVLPSARTWVQRKPSRITQSGFVQLIGCCHAKFLNQHSRLPPHVCHYGSVVPCNAAESRVTH